LRDGYYVPGGITTMMRLLRRSVQGSVHQ
jgi:hypothetical protein